jgi:hypothetical protein
MLRRHRDALEREAERWRDVLRAREKDIDAALRRGDALENVAKNDAKRYEAELAAAKRDWDLEIEKRVAKARREAIDSIPTFAECAEIFDGLAETLGANLKPANYPAEVRQLKCDLDESLRQREFDSVAHKEAVRSHEEHRKAMAAQAEEHHKERGALADAKVRKACNKFHDVLDQAKRIVDHEIRGGR